MTDQVLVIAEDDNDTAELGGLLYIIKQSELVSDFHAPQLINRPVLFEEYDRLRILRGDTRCDLARRAIEYFTLEGLPVAYHTLTVTTSP